MSKGTSSLASGKSLVVMALVILLSAFLLSVSACTPLKPKEKPWLGTATATTTIRDTTTEAGGHSATTQSTVASHGESTTTSHTSTSVDRTTTTMMWRGTGTSVSR
jgi:hypothetical protein